MFLSASWEHLDSFVTPLDYSWRALSRLRSLQERPSLVKNNWETIKKPLRRCQEGPRSVQERARLVKESQIFWTCSTNFQKFLVLPTVQESSRSVKKCQELVTEVAKKYQDINFGTLLVQIRIVGQGPKLPFFSYILTTFASLLLRSPFLQPSRIPSMFLLIIVSASSIGPQSNLKVTKCSSDEMPFRISEDRLIILRLLL